MKKFIFVLIFTPFLLSCSLNENSEKMNVDLVEKYVQAVEDADIDTMESLLSEEYLGLGPSMNDSIGKSLLLENWKFLSETYYESLVYKRSRNASVIIDSGDNKGEWVSNWSELTVVFKLDHQSVTIWSNTVYKIENDKIVRSFTFYNEADALEQLGYVFVHPGENL